jgi:hypothetical protein
VGVQGRVGVHVVIAVKGQEAGVKQMVVGSGVNLRRLTQTVCNPGLSTRPVGLPLTKHSSRGANQTHSLSRVTNVTCAICVTALTGGC